MLCLSLRERVDKLWPSMTEDERIVAKSYVIEHVSIDKVARSIGDTRSPGAPPGGQPDAAAPGRR